MAEVRGSSNLRSRNKWKFLNLGMLKLISCLLLRNDVIFIIPLHEWAFVSVIQDVVEMKRKRNEQAPKWILTAEGS